MDRAFLFPQEERASADDRIFDPFFFFSFCFSAKKCLIQYIYPVNGNRREFDLEGGGGRGVAKTATELSGGCRNFVSYEYWEPTFDVPPVGIVVF